MYALWHPTFIRASAVNVEGVSFFGQAHVIVCDQPLVVFVYIRNAQHFGRASTTGYPVRSLMVLPSGVDDFAWPKEGTKRAYGPDERPAAWV